VKGTLDSRSLAGATLALLVGIFAVGSEALVISPLLADIAHDLGVGIDGAGLSVSMYGLAVAVMAPMAGYLGERISRRRTLLLGLVVFAVGGVLCAAAPNLGTLIAGRAVCGVGTGMFLPSAYAWVGDEVPYEDRARVMGRVVFGWALALVAGVPLGGLIGQVAGWREALAAMAVLAVGAAVAAARLLPRRTHGGPHPADSPAAPGLLTAALKVPGVPRLLTVNLLGMFAFYGVYTYLGSFVREELEVESGVAGAIILLYGLGVAVIALNGRLLDRFGKSRALVVALVLNVVIMASLPWLGGVPVALAAVVAIFGITQGGFLTAMATETTQASDASRGSVVALMSAGTYVGVTLGAAVMGPIFDGPGFGLVGAISSATAAVAIVIYVGRRRQVIVAAVIERGHRVLIAQRAEGPLAGFWEFPGGKRERGERDATALRREIDEELGICVEVGALVASAGDGPRELRFFRCEYSGGGRPRPLVHTQFRWVRRADLTRYSFPPPNLHLVRLLAAEATTPPLDSDRR
jgi:DHA1 family inner membrane transport protein